MTMNKKILLLVCVLLAGFCAAYAEPNKNDSLAQASNELLMKGLDDESDEIKDLMLVNVNLMPEATRDKLNKTAELYRSNANTRGNFWENLGLSMLEGGLSGVVNVVGTEIINLIQVKSKQRKAWEEMRQKECSFVDSLQSVKGQTDFYASPSGYGPLDPGDMNFDGITLNTQRDDKEVLNMVCHIDTTKLDHLFCHSKFYLVVDSISFYPYRSYLPNLKANNIEKPKGEKVSKDEIDYWNTISQFDFNEHQSPTINIRMDLYSSWINELVQVYQDVKLGSFSLNIPISPEAVNDSVYVYSRKEALEKEKKLQEIAAKEESFKYKSPVIEVEGDCFVVPRSYMPVSANTPSWGTGEYKLKVVLSQNCRYNPKDGRSAHWRHDYKQLVKMQKNARKNQIGYWSEIVTTFRDNGFSMLKASYMPGLNYLKTETVEEVKKKLK